MGFSSHEYWSGLPFPSPGDLPNPGVEPGSPTLKVDAYHLSYQGSLSKHSGTTHLRVEKVQCKNIKTLQTGKVLVAAG